MISYDKKEPSSDGEAETIRLYGPHALELVSNGYRRAQSYFASIQMRGEYKGNFLMEVLHKLPDVPPLLNAEEFEQFLHTSPDNTPYTPQEALKIIRSILKDALNERNLRSGLIIGHDDQAIVILLR